MHPIVSVVHILIERESCFMAAISGDDNASNAVTLQSLGEFAVIDRLKDIAKLGSREISIPDPVVGSGDDSAIVAFGSAHVAMSVDLFVQDRHFRTDWSTGVDIGRRCAAASMSDICAMGVEPSTLLVGVAAPPETTMSWITEMYSGLVEEAAIAGARVVGGDLSSAIAIMISVTALGQAPKKGAVTRSGARVGDVVAVHGALGRAAAGLRVLQRGLRSPRSLVDSYRFPHVDYTAGVRARDAGAHAMIDVSDGLVADLRHIADASVVTINIDKSLLMVPEDLTSAAAAFGLDPLTWVLEGGDDHAIIATFPVAATLPAGFHAIGVVNERGEHSVTVDQAIFEGSGGYSHFHQ